MDSTFELLTATLLPGLRPRGVRDLVARGAIGEVLRRPGEHGDLLRPDAQAALRSGAARARARAEADRAGALGIAIVGWDEPAYPERLRQTYDPPPVLYVRGRLEAGEGERSVAVVGARRASPGGTVLARAMAAELAGSGVVVVSGLARGIDGAAHRGALDARGRTVAVLGSGLDRVYPGEHAGLAAAIAERGAVVSEFPLGTRPHKANFPRRNRVIAGWGRAVVVVEAAETSGALVTARAALDEGREVLAVPGRPSDPWAAGTNGLIRDGARLVRGAADVAEELGLPRPAAAAEAEADVLLASFRKDAPASLEELAERNGRDVAFLLARLAELELTGKVKRLPGALFARI